MTRWTRANNAHKRQPSDAASWKELRGDGKDTDWRQTRRNNSKELRKQRRRMKTCFKCRQFGHTISDCPSMSSNTNEVGICFRCGSTEHKSHSCSVKPTEGQPEYPFALCFVCGEKGHLSSSCKNNEAGMYPKGGACHACGSVRHLKRDCPTLKPEKNDEEKQIVLKRIPKKGNIEEEEYDSSDKEIETIPKKKKIKTITFK